MTEEAKTTEEHKKEGFKLGNLVGGSSTKERLENASYLIIFVSAVMVSIGIAAGIVFPGALIVSVLGAFLVMAGIVLFVISQFFGE
jgi:hypothetical protein